MRVSTGPFRAFMKKNELTHKQVAVDTDHSVHTINAFMQGRFSFDTLRDVCRVYRLQPNDVIEFIHDQCDDGAFEFCDTLPDKLKFIFLKCDDMIQKRLIEGTAGMSVEEVYRDAFLDCLDLCFEYL